VTEHGGEARLPSECIVEMHGTPTGDHEDVRYAVGDEKIGDDVRHTFHRYSILGNRDRSKTSCHKELSKLRHRAVGSVDIVHGQR